jgi:aminoglycoside phosphotransferase (APT) family kinase protein
MPHLSTDPPARREPGPGAPGPAGAHPATAPAATLDVEALARFMRDHVPELGDELLALDATLIAGGRSNLTFAIGDGRREWVLRRPPLGVVLPSAHDMSREYRALRALCDTDVPVPRPVVSCEDPAVLGAPFYLMERVPGEVVRTVEDALALTAEQARRLSIELVETLAAIHRVDFRRVGLADFGRPDGYLERQLRRWASQWERSKTRELAAVEEVARRLRRACPPTYTPALVHGDFRLDNVIVRRDAHIAAVLDWELSTIGDALSDVGFLLMNWGASGPILVDRPVPPGSGFATCDELAAGYRRASGVEVEQLDFYVVLAYYKVAVIFEGIHARQLAGMAVGDGAGGFGARAAQTALELADRSQLAALRHG